MNLSRVVFDIFLRKNVVSHIKKIVSLLPYAKLIDYIMRLNPGSDITC